jgi:probable rRNA maturation factor
MAIHFFAAEEDKPYPFKNKLKIKTWLKNVATNEGYSIKDIVYVFCTDEYLLSINKRFLNHDTFTDIITFDYTEEKNIVGEIYISFERIKENAMSFKTNQTEELNRVMVHGLLHLMGYKDKGKGNKANMTEKENFYLNKRMFHVKQWAAAQS